MFQPVEKPLIHLPAPQVSPAPPSVWGVEHSMGEEQTQPVPLNSPASAGHDFSDMPVLLAAKSSSEPAGQEDEAEEEHPKEEAIPSAPAASKKGEKDTDGCFQILASGPGGGPPVAGQVRPLPPVADTEGAAFAGKVDWGRPAKFPQIFGYTVYDPSQIEKWPSFVWRSTLEATDALGTSWQAYATPASEEGYKVTADDSNNPVFQKYVLKYPNYSYFVRVSPKAAEIIAAAEQQHINDLSEGWEITGKATAKAINEVAKQEPDTRAEAVTKVESKLGDLGKPIHSGLSKGGRLEDSLRPLLDNAGKKSKEVRDDSKKHDLGLDYVMADDQKKAVLFEVNEDFKLDKTASSDVVNLKAIIPDESKAGG